MTFRQVLLRSGIIAAMLLGTCPSVAADTLRMGGVGAATKMLPVLFAAFDRSEEHKLEVVPSLGSSGGLRALSAGVLDLAVTGRVLNPDELAQGLTQVAAVRTPFVLISSHPKPNGLNSAEIADIFRSPKATWADGTMIRIVLRPRSDSDTPVLGGMFPGMAAAIEAARKRQEVPLAATDQDNAALAEQAPGSLAGSTFTQIKTEQRKVRLVSIDGVEPSLENLERGAYPFSKTLYFVLPAKKKFPRGTLHRLFAVR
jgi:phosphate transport system substrate-binding protein